MRTNVMRKFHYASDQSRLSVAHKALAKKENRPTFFVERAVIMFDKVHVTYIEQRKLESGTSSEADWKDGIINLADLEWHTLIAFANVHMQSDVTLAIYVEDNLNDCVKSYLDAGKEVI